jgi:site-specific recombinase XerD
MCPNQTKVTNYPRTPQESGKKLEFVTEESAEVLNHRQLVDYNEHRKQFIQWLKTRGKVPEKQIGYAESTVKNYAARLDKFYRWVWEQYGGYTTQITHEHADEYARKHWKNEFRKPNGSTYSGTHKRKNADAIENLFKWRAHERNGEKWSPDVTFNEKTRNKPKPFSKAQRRKLREASLEYGNIPKYNDLSPEERDRWKAYLAQQLGKPKERISPDDWTRVNQSWKIPSMIFSTSDAGFRPVEMKKADVGWFNPEKGIIEIPPEASIKRGEEEEVEEKEVALTDRTVKILQRWVQERENYPKYDDTDALWLNRKGNRYNSDSLNYLLRNLCEEAGVDQEDDHSWYSIRHTVGTYLTSEGDLGEAQTQLRHENPETTMKYLHPPPEERQDTLEGL